MTDERSPESALRGRLADVFVPALVAGTLDDPRCGRASSLVSIEPLLARMSAFFADGRASYEHVASTTGVDRDTSEGRLTMTVEGVTVAVPIAVVHAAATAILSFTRGPSGRIAELRTYS